MRIIKVLLFILFVGLTSCIQEDIVDDAVSEVVRIVSCVTKIREGDEIELEAAYFNEVGEKESRDLIWESKDSSILTIDNNLAKITGVTKGITTVSVQTEGENGILLDSITIEVLDINDPEEIQLSCESSKKGTLEATSFYVSQGDFTIVETDSGIRIDVAGNYSADTTLPGFAMFLTNNPASIANAREVDAFDDADGGHYSGAFSFNVDGVGLNEYKYLVHWCRPFNVKVGEAKITDN